MRFISTRDKIKLILLLALLIVFTACTPKKDSINPSLEQLSRAQADPQMQDKVLKSMGQSWIYGNGFGDTLLAAGTVFMFPPSALYFLGNAALDLSGYEPIHVSDALPEAPRQGWNEIYDDVSSGPGKLSAALAGKEFITRERAKELVNESLSQTTTK